MSTGARFIWNTRFFHIAKNGEKLSGFAVSGDYVSGLVEYVGTRETVALNIQEKYKDLPATEKQKNLLDELFRAVPEHKNFLEYDDYTQAPTRQNASELISCLSEQVQMHGEFNEAANLVEYAAQRPGVVKVGEHGLFSSEDTVDLDKAKNDLSTHEGNIWTHVLSLRREDADRLGYDSQAPWKNLVKSNISVLAQAHNIKLDNLGWYAAMHNTGHHPHIHLFVFSKNPNEGFFSQKGDNNSIEMCKQAFATKIFAADLENEYVAKTEYREELKSETKEILKSLMENPIGYYSEQSQTELIKKFLQLSNSLDPNKEIKYGYLKADLKELVNDIQKQLVYDNEKLSALYMKWCEHQFNIERVYITKPTEVPIDENKEFTPIKNEIIKQARLLALEFKDSSFDISKILEQPRIDKDKNLFPDFKADDKKNTEKFNNLQFVCSDINTRTGDDCCKLADCYQYGLGTPKDSSLATMWYGIASDQYQNSVAAYRIGEIYSKGTETVEQDIGLSEQYYKQAYYTIKHEIENWESLENIEKDIEIKEYFPEVSQTDAYKEYLVGCMYYDGKGVEQSYEKAYQAFLLASANGNEKAKYNLGTMLLSGKGTEQNMEAGVKFLSDVAVNSKNPTAAYKLYQHYKNCEDPALSRLYLTMASNCGHTMAQTQLGVIEYNKDNIDDAIKLFRNAAKKGNPDASFYLGQIYGNSDNLEHYNSDLSAEYYKKAFDKYTNDFNKTGNGFTAYKIGRMYQKGLGVTCDPTEAIKWYNTASNKTGEDYKEEKEEAERQMTVPVGSIISTVLHMGRVFRNNTLNSNKNRYAPDKKVAIQEKERKISAGQAQDDTVDYNY